MAVLLSAIRDAGYLVHFAGVGMEQEERATLLPKVDRWVKNFDHRFSRSVRSTGLGQSLSRIVATLRPRTRDEPGPWLVHLRNPSQPPVAEVSYETDRMRFIGRGRSTADPQALHGDGPLSGCAGAVLDAVAAVRCTISLKPGPTPSFDLIAGVCGSRDACLGLAARTRYPALGDRARACAPVHAREVPSTLKASEADALWFTRLAGCVMYANAALRAAPDILASHHDLGASTEHADEAPRRDLLFDNGTGGFIADGRECVITTGAGWITPLPWVNVLANPSFGALLSESGSATTWIENAQAFRLTPWSNDPVGAPNIEVCCILDEDSGHTWSPTLLPSGGTATYVTRHGFGNNVFEHERGIGSESVVVVAQDAPVKFVQLTLRNASGRARRLSVTGYLQWVLGDEPAKPQMFVNTEIDAARTRTAADGPGDWSDGMNLVGTAGKGDSVRLGFFLCRAMCVACAKTVASTRTLRSGWRWPSRHSATPSVRWNVHAACPHPPRQFGRRRDPVQDGALRHGGRCLCAAPAGGPQRLVLVHGRGRLDAAVHPGIAAGPEGRGPAIADRPVHAGALEVIPGGLPLSAHAVSHHRDSNAGRGWIGGSDARRHGAPRPGDSSA